MSSYDQVADVIWDHLLSVNKVERESIISSHDNKKNFVFGIQNQTGDSSEKR